jgi:bifunctional ADP-heptose synthase (sugar kinase/adenylyltransferase)
MLASGADLPSAVRIANRAAGIVVGKLGTAVVSREEIIKDIGEEGMGKGER